MFEKTNNPFGKFSAFWLVGTKSSEVHKKKLGPFMIKIFAKIFCSSVSLLSFKRTFCQLKESLIYLLFC